MLKKVFDQRMSEFIQRHSLTNDEINFLEQGTQMTKKELQQKMLDFINDQSTVKDEWYFSDRSMAFNVLFRFAQNLGIELPNPDEEQ